MADITNPQAVRFCNENARTLADLIVSFYRTYDQFILNVVRDFEDQTSANAGGDVVVDGSSEDGRQSVTKTNVGELKYVAEQLRTRLDQDSIIALANQWAVNGRPIY